MTYKLQPELKEALSALPLRERLKTRAKLHRRLKKLAATDNAICGLFNSYDCGAELIDHITGGRLTRLEAKRREQEAAVLEITKPLLTKEPPTTNQEELS